MIKSSDPEVPWQPDAFTNLVTGERRPVVHSPDNKAHDMCTPVFCAVWDGKNLFVQNPDATGRTILPYPGAEITSVSAGDQSLIMVSDKVLLDPLSGRYALRPLYPDSCGWFEVRAEAVVRGSCPDYAETVFLPPTH
jgi:hypothetical protein